MAIPVDVQAALTRLSTGAPTGYNNGPFNAGTNQYGFGGLGYITLVFALTDDVDLVTTYVATLSDAVLLLEPQLVALGAISAELAALGGMTADLTALAA